MKLVKILAMPEAGSWIATISGNAAVILSKNEVHQVPHPTIGSAALPKAIAAIHWGSCDTTKQMDPEDRVNTYLIAAAPDLLHAAREAISVTPDGRIRDILTAAVQSAEAGLE